MGRSFWHYQLILFSLFFLWGGFFTSGTFLNQIGFNFAVFYPLGMYAGYRKKPNGIQEVYGAALGFNLFTYAVAFLGGGLAALPGVSLSGVDFLSMALVLGIGITMGRRLRA